MVNKQMINLLNRNELRRLEKAAREKNKQHLMDWLTQFEAQLRVEYEKNFQEEIGEAVDHLLIAIAYSLHYSEETKFGKKRLNRFMDDLIAVTEGFRTGDYNPEDYKKQLKDDGIIVFNKNKEEI